MSGDERYHKHGPSSDPVDVERRAMRREESLHGPEGWCGETRPHEHGLSEGIITYTDGGTAEHAPHDDCHLYPEATHTEADHDTPPDYGRIIADGGPILLSECAECRHDLTAHGWGGGECGERQCECATFTAQYMREAAR